MGLICLYCIFFFSKFRGKNCKLGIKIIALFVVLRLVKTDISCVLFASIKKKY